MRSPQVVRWFIRLALVDLLWVAHNRHGGTAAGIAAFELLLLWGLNRGWFLCWLLLLGQYVLEVLAGFHWAGWDSLVLSTPALVLAGLLLTTEMRIWVGIGLPAGPAKDPPSR
jgi:hypothetical protein